MKIDGTRTRLGTAPHRGRLATDHGYGAVRTGEATDGDPCRPPAPAMTTTSQSRLDLSLTTPGRVRHG